MDGRATMDVCSTAVTSTGHRHRTVGEAGVVAVLLLLPALGSASPPVIEPRTLDRLHDPVIVRTGRLEGLPDRHTASYRLYAGRRGALEPIPFQFDERGADGELVLSPDGTETEFTFDGDDELVFMAKDTGDRIADAVLPASSDATVEIEVSDRGRAAQGWVYLVHFAGDPPPRSPVRYATFDAARQEARAPSYQVSYSHDRSNYLRGLRIPPSAGGTGESLIDRLAMRINPTFSLLLTTFHLSLTEESFSVEPDGLKNGPVRAIRRVRQSLDLGKVLPEIPKGRVYTHYYASSFRTPSRFSIPWLALKTLRDFRFESVNELATPADGLRYWDASNPEGVPFGGEGRPAGADADHDWWVLGGGRGTCLQVLLIPEEWRAWGIKRGIVFEDGAGYSLLRMTNLRRAGAYDLGSAFVVLPRPYRPGDEAEALAGFRDPLETDVRTMAAERGPTRSATR
jgi:hypothetical protein